MAKKITFESLSPTLQRALKLLRKVKGKARIGVGNHSYSNCPIANSYRGVFARTFWGSLRAKDREKLKAAGWDSRAYNVFIAWYDYMYERICDFEREKNQREKFLLEYLSD